jgi:hypothetical protein
MIKEDNVHAYAYLLSDYDSEVYEVAKVRTYYSLSDFDQVREEANDRNFCGLWVLPLSKRNADKYFKRLAYVDAPVYARRHARGWRLFTY